MENINYENISFQISTIKIILINICMYFTYMKITNNDRKIVFNRIIDCISVVLISILIVLIRNRIDYITSLLFWIFILSLYYSLSEFNKLGSNILCITISLGINYIFLFIGIFCSFIINSFIPIKSDFLNLLILFFMQSILICSLYRIPKLKNGISFLNKDIRNEYLDIIILNISIIVAFSFILFDKVEFDNVIFKRLPVGLLIYIIIFFITIQKSIQAYYKQKLLIQDLTETKRELEEKKKEVAELENENLKTSMRSHSIAHKQKALEYKLNKILQSSETAEEIDLKDRMEKVAKEAYAIPFAIKLMKTEVAPIDDMIEFMQAECIKNSIEFDLIINGNIHKMVNNYIEKEDLEVLLADHIKDAIIAINHTDNINRSILVKLGEFDNYYSLNIYDSGVNFPKEIIENLGKMPVTSYLGEGGTGMGYMNTFNLLNKYKASLTIEEFGTPSKENYTKVISIIFDNKNEFKIL